MLDSNLCIEAEKLNILFKYNDTIHIGSYLDQDVVYPDYSSMNISKFIQELYNLISKYVPDPIDGLILKDNWPSDNNFRMNGTDFKYFTVVGFQFLFSTIGMIFIYLLQDFERAMSFTLPWNSTSPSKESHVHKHNSYGANHLEAIKQFYINKNPNIFIMSATKSLEQTEPQFIENVDASWDELSNKLQNVLFESISGNHLVTFPVCGDTKNYDPIRETLCLRWYLIATTMPLLRISSEMSWRDPEHLNTTYAKKQARQALHLRDQLLPYYYTILSKNQPVLRPMFYDFYDDNATFKMETQYMIGDTILVAHPFTPGRTLLRVYLPNTNKIWYEMWGGRLYNSTTQPLINISIIESDFVAFLAQGSILPLMVRPRKFNLVVLK